MAAFDGAVQEGADMIELDLHPTRDGRLVVLHDVTTTRTTGVAHRAQDLTIAQLRCLDAGSGQRIPTLEEVLTWAKDRVYLNLDTRNYPALDSYHDDATAAALVTAIEDAGVADQVLVQCLDHQLARAVHDRCPAVMVGITQHGRPVDTVALARTAGATLVSGDAAFATRDLVSELHTAGIGLMTSVELRLPGLPDDPAITHDTTARLLAVGVDIVVTDDLNTTTAMVGGRCRLPPVADTARYPIREVSCPPRQATC